MLIRALNLIHDWDVKIFRKSNKRQTTARKIGTIEQSTSQQRHLTRRW